MTDHTKAEPRQFSWLRPLYVCGWLTLSAIIAVCWNFGTASWHQRWQIDMLALTLGFLAAYYIGHHKAASVSVKSWLFVSVQALFSGLAYNFGVALYRVIKSALAGG